MLQRITKRDLTLMAASGDASKKVRRYLQELGTSIRWQAAAGAAVPEGRFADVDATTGLLKAHASDSDQPLGVTAEHVGKSSFGHVRALGLAEVDAGHSIAAMAQIVSTPGGVAATALAAAADLATAVVGADSSDDLDQTNLPDKLSFICAADETGNTAVIYGDVGGVLTKETLALGVAATYTSVNTWAAVYGIRTTQAAVGTIDVKDATLTGYVFPQISALDAARFYGAIIPDVSTDSKGLEVRAAAGGANTSDVVLLGTDYAGAEQMVVITMTGTTDVLSALSWRSLTQMLIGADGIAWNAGATSAYDADVAATVDTDIRGYAIEAQATAGSKVLVFLSPWSPGIAALGTAGPLSYQGAWHAGTDTPAFVAASAANKGHVWVVSADGSTAVDGITDWKQTDWRVSNGSVWEKIDNTDLVASVAGKTGVVVLVPGDITEKRWELPIRVASMLTDADNGAADPVGGSIGEARVVNNWATKTDGDIEEWDGAAWQTIVSNAGGFVPIGTRVGVDGAAAAGGFAGQDGDIAVADGAGAWAFTTPQSDASTIIGPTSVWAGAHFRYDLASTTWVFVTATTLPELIAQLTDVLAMYTDKLSEIHSTALKGAPVGADELLMEDSAASWAKVRATLTSLGFAAGLPRYKGIQATVGGAASEAFTCAGVLATDALHATLNTDTVGGNYVRSVSRTGVDTVTVVFAVDPLGVGSEVSITAFAP